MSFFAELKRRNVVRVGVAYIVIGWILAQVAEFAFENFGAPDWVLKTFIAVLLLGLPLALFFAWAFELTPEGIKREEEVDRSQSITQLTGRKLDFVIIGALVVSLGYFLWERQSLVESFDSVDAVETSEEAAVADAQAIALATPDRRSIAVLPFVNMSSDEDQSWFADGLTEEILNALARAPDLLVSARTSSFAFKGSSEDIPTIADALGVDHILEGSVRRGGGRLRITAQLIRAIDGFHLWSQTFDSDSEDLIAIQEEIAIQIASALDTAMDPEALAKMVSAGTSFVPAFEAYLEGLGYQSATDTSGDIYLWLEARDAYERAVALDPEFSAAYFELYIFWDLQLQTNQITYGLTDLSHEERIAKRDEMLDKAIRFATDPITKMGYRASKAWDDLNYQSALRLLTDFIEARPSDEYAKGLKILLLRRMGKYAESYALIKSVYEQGGMARDLAGWATQALRAYDDAEFKRTFAMDVINQYPDDVFVLYQAHRLLLWADDIDGASNVLSMFINSDMPEESRNLALLRQRCAELRHADARNIHDRLLAKYPDDLSFKWLSYKILGDDDDAAQLFVEHDQNGNFFTIASYLAYEHFDPGPYPNFMQAMAGQGIEVRKVFELPYRCNR
jgi:TolB-like protein